MKKIIKIVTIIALLGFIVSSMPNVAAETGLQVSFTENPIVIAPGSGGYIELNLKNTGNNAVNYIDIETDILDPYVIKYKGNWDVFVGTLDLGESTTIIYEFTVPTTASPGLYQVIFETDSSASDTKVSAFIRVEDSSILDIESVTPSLIKIGEVSVLNFNISNSGGKSINTILFTWDDKDDLILPIGSDNRFSIDLIQANDFVLLPIVVMASPSITPGVYPLTITMSYSDDTGTTTTITSSVGIQVSGGTDFEIILQQSTTSGTTFAVANTGANTASSVIVSIPMQPNYITSGTSSVSLGNLDAGDYTLASFQLSSINQNTDQNITNKPKFNRDLSEISPDFNQKILDQMENRTTEGTIDKKLIVEISYTDLYGLRQRVEKEVLVTSISSTGSDDLATRMTVRGITGVPGQEELGISLGTIYVIVGVAGILLIVVFLQLGKKKKIPYISKIVKGRDNENH